MLAELKSNSQITIPPEVIRSMGYVEGDKFEIIAHENGIFLCPVVEYPPEVVERVKAIIAESEEFVANQEPYSDVREMFKDMGIDVDEVLGV